MGMRLRHLQVHIETSDGPFGITIGFQNGMTVIRADNSSGKSTCMMAIMYGLGLEGMLGPSHQPPFAEVMLDTLLDGLQVLAVNESFVRLEIENDRDERLTCKRFVCRQCDIDPLRVRQLIQVSEGGAISNPSGDFVVKDFFVRIAHSAQSASGFHHRLAEFIGYVLPNVPGTDQGQVPLYLETLFPFFFVDQLSGWRDIKARMPTHLRIPEMAKRATEFILHLDILDREIKRQAISQREEVLRQQWRNRIVVAQSEVQGKAVVLHGFPETPTDLWPPKGTTPQIMYTDGNNWRSIESALKIIEDKLLELAEPVFQPIQTLTPDQEQTYLLLREAENHLIEVREQVLAIGEKDRLEELNIRAIDQRLRTLSEELTDYRETKKILDRGGFAELKTAQGVCPTCRQTMKDTLLPQSTPNAPMSLEDNIHYIKDEYDAYEQMRRQALSATQSRQTAQSQLRRREAEIAQSIREYRRTLIAPMGTPSAARIGEQLRLEHEMDRLREIGEWCTKLVDDVKTMANTMADIKRDRKSLGEDGISATDSAKIRKMTEVFREQLTLYGFRSFKVEEIGLSPVTYRAIRHEFDVGLTSASDAVRLIWAYLLSMLEVARSIEFTTNHLGMLVFDEPKQQNAEDISLDQLFHRAAQSIQHGQQVIVATSEESVRLSPMLAEVECQYLDFPRGSRLIARLQDKRGESATPSSLTEESQDA